MQDFNKELTQYNARYAGDSGFSRRARLQQSKWREAQGYPIGKTQGGTLMGNYIEKEYAHKHKVNLLTDEIRAIATEEAGNSKKTGALIQEKRLWENMLSSQPLCFNLFGHMHYDLELATKFFRDSFPERGISKVTTVRFEYSPGRGDKSLTGDHSAFDAFVEDDTVDGAKAFIGIEVKYAETLMEGSNSVARTYAQHRDEYLRVSENAGIFNMDSIEDMATSPKFQIWRDHLLALSMLQSGLYDDGFFLFLYPFENAECENGFCEYRNALNTQENDSENQSHIYGRDIFDYIRRLDKLVGQSWSRNLVERYTWDKEE